MSDTPVSDRPVNLGEERRKREIATHYAEVAAEAREVAKLEEQLCDAEERLSEKASDCALLRSTLKNVIEAYKAGGVEESRIAALVEIYTRTDR